jgi:hypothetical protein
MRKVTVGILSLILCFCCACTSSNPVISSNSGESHLQEALINSFNLQWYEDCSRFQDLVKKAAAAKSTEKGAADYLLGYIDCDSNAQPKYINIIFTSQQALKKPVLPQQLNQPFTDFFTAKTKFQTNLKAYLQKEEHLPTDGSFQKNMQELASLSDDLFVRINEIQSGEGVEKFKKTLEQAAECMDAAFSDSVSK